MRKPMDMHLLIDRYLSQIPLLITRLDLDRVHQAAELIYDAWQNDRRLVLCGNGGSASTASHLVCDFQKILYLEGGKPFEAIALTDSPALLSAWANDTDYENVFAGQARTWLREGDILLAISGSGNSPNVLSAVSVAKEQGAKSIGLAGFGGGKLARCVDIPIAVPCEDMQLCEDMHMMLGHLLFRCLRDRVAKNS